jgi:leucyl/phenylalanyl-tRNA--protein transferase
LNQNRIVFPDVETAYEDGLLALGGDLKPETLLTAYTSGIFPWTVKPISWWSPDPRAIFDIETFAPSPRAKRYLRNSSYRISFDEAFAKVMEKCSEPYPGREESWVTIEFIRAYCKMHELGFAHSVEVWDGSELVGGVYGVAIRGFFAGESMFYRKSNASTIALLALIDRLLNKGYSLFDSQVITPHTARLGAIEIPRKEYLARLKNALKRDCKF